MYWIVKDSSVRTLRTIKHDTSLSWPIMPVMTVNYCAFLPFCFLSFLYNITAEIARRELHTHTHEHRLLNVLICLTSCSIYFYYVESNESLTRFSLCCLHGPTLQWPSLCFIASCIVAELSTGLLSLKKKGQTNQRKVLARADPRTSCQDWYCIITLAWMNEMFHPTWWMPPCCWCCTSLPAPHQPKITSSDLSSKYIAPACASEINVSNYNPHLQL